MYIYIALLEESRGNLPSPSQHSTCTPLGAHANNPAPCVGHRFYCDSFAFHSGVSINEVMLRGMRTLLAKEGRTEEFDALLRKSRGRYRSTLDKLEDRET